jgi:hypothetical protein
MPTLTGIPVPDRAAVLDALARHGDAFVGLLRRHPDPTRPVPGLTWTTGQLAAHMVMLGEGYTSIVLGKDSPYSSTDPAEVAKINETTGRAVLDRGGNLAERVDVAWTELRETLAADDLPVTVVHAGIPLAPLNVGAVAIGELLIHGHDLAGAFAEPWVIAGEQVDLVSAGVSLLMPHVLTPKARRFTGTYQMRLRGQGSHIFRFLDGVLTGGRAWDGPVDCRISADPATYLLAGYGRIGPIRPALTGRMVVYGRKPWLGPRFATLVQAP